jgi:hypothetical protein
MTILLAIFGSAAGLMVWICRRRPAWPDQGILEQHG